MVTEEDLPTPDVALAAPRKVWTARDKRDLVRFLGIQVAAVAGVLWFGVTPGVLALAAALYVVRMFGVTAGYHRYFSHRTFKTSRWFAFVLAFLAESSAQRGVIWWARQHRHHHRHSDGPADLHSPKDGVLWAHMGWLFNDARWSDANTVSDLERSPELVWLDRHWLLPPVLVGAACFAAGGFPALFGGFLFSTVLTWHATYTINSLAHVWGTRRFETADTSRNNAFLALITLGEGWHNNHHFDMRSCRQGLAWWEIDLTYGALRVLAALGLVWDLRGPSPAATAALGRGR
jgi:stearoyl-CoA desaturase (delta-9 desaturase)